MGQLVHLIASMGLPSNKHNRLRDGGGCAFSVILWDPNMVSFKISMDISIPVHKKTLFSERQKYPRKVAQIYATPKASVYEGEGRMHWFTDRIL